MAETKQPSAAEKAVSFFSKFVVPFVFQIFVYSISSFWALVVVYNLIKRYHKQPSKICAVKKRPLPPKELLDPELGNHSYIHLPHVKLHYVESGSKEKPLMILLHGFPEFWYSWRHQIKEFSKDYWVVAVDMRGYGDSDKPPSVKYYNMKYLIGDVKNLIEGLGQKKAIVVAHDWGGIVAWQFARLYPEMVEKMVVINAPQPTAFRKLMWSTFSQFLKSWYIFFFQLPFLPEVQMLVDDMSFFKGCFRSKKKGSVMNEDELEAYKFTYGKPGAFFGPIGYYRANIFSGANKLKKPDANSVEFPKTFLIFGDDDVAIDSKVVEMSKKFCPNLTTEIVPGGCHFVHEEEPEIVNAKIKQFLSA
ncbi:epoxide hydrolase [Nesidiocoris tenuis]|uniref:Epoxide hydrolase n=1 Tax=Nesidiocoris tenuis TaxID=355587 RepID=A0ABN7BEU3_9HEMI|nr:epoxide hydrolase [Nesidiocoris tenuis]